MSLMRAMKGLATAERMPADKGGAGKGERAELLEPTCKGRDAPSATPMLPRIACLSKAEVA